MNGYLTSALSAMLGWVRGLASSVWQIISGENTGSLLRYIAEHWKGILLILCIVGVAADFVVYLLRWQPYKVWSSFLRRLKEGKKQPGADAMPTEDQQALLTGPDEPQPLLALPERIRRRRRAYFPENEPAEDDEMREPVMPAVGEADPEPTVQTPAPRRRRRRSFPDE